MTTNIFGKLCHLLSTLHDLRYRHFTGWLLSPIVDLCRKITWDWVFRQMRRDKYLVKSWDGKWHWEASGDWEYRRRP